MLVEDRAPGVEQHPDGLIEQAVESRARAGIGKMAREVAQAYYNSREVLGFPMCKSQKIIGEGK